jgi:hypothetical protein
MHNGAIRKKAQNYRAQPGKNQSIHLFGIYLGMMRPPSFSLAIGIARPLDYRTWLSLSQERANTLQFVLLDCFPGFRPVGRQLRSHRYFGATSEWPVIQDLGSFSPAPAQLYDHFPLRQNRSALLSPSNPRTSVRTLDITERGVLR